MLEIFRDLLLLFGLGCLGWLILVPLRVPIPALFGALIIVGTLRMLEYPLPLSPVFLSPLIQVVLGLYVGSKVTRNTVKELKTMTIPAVIIVAWTLSIVFLLGYFLSYVTILGPVEAILSSSMGGLPEMTVIALAMDADIAVIMIMQTLRMIITNLTFPFILKIYMKNDNKSNVSYLSVTTKRENDRKIEKQSIARSIIVPLKNCLSILKLAPFKIKFYFQLSSIKWSLASLAIAAAGGWLFLSLGVPAGGMVGAMFFVAIVSLLKVPVVTPSPKTFNFMLLGVGLMVSDNLTSETLDALMTGDILLPVIISTIIIFISSIGVAYLVHRLTGWDFPTSFLAAAPGGFTIMTTLAIKYNRDPLRVSMLHLCRLLSIKTIVPLAFMIYI